MGHKKRQYRSSSSQGQISGGTDEDEGLGSSSGSQSSSQESLERERYRRLSKKDLKKLIQLERKIQRQEQLLRRAKDKKKPKQILKKPQPKKQPSQKQQKSFPQQDSPDKKKLFITGISDKYSQQQVNEEMTKALKNIPGVTGFRIKRKQGSSTYAFVDFSTCEDAREGKEKMKNKRLFGEKVVIQYSSDDKKVHFKMKQCFQCQGFGHYARECQKRKIQEQEYKKIDSKFDNLKEPQTNEIQQVKQEDNIEEKAVTKRIVRDKFRLSRLLGQK